MKKSFGKKKGPPPSPPPVGAVEGETEAAPSKIAPAKSKMKKKQPAVERVELPLTEESNVQLNDLQFSKSEPAKKKNPLFVNPLQKKAQSEPKRRLRPNMLEEMNQAHENIQRSNDEYSALDEGEEKTERVDLLQDIRTFKKGALQPALPQKKMVKAVDDYNFEEDEDYEIPKGPPMVIDYQKLYSDYLAEGAEAFPIHKLKYILLQINSRSDVTLNFSGVSVLTDITFAVLADLLPREGARLKAVTNVSLDGCHQITDAGIAWLGRAFPNLTWLSCVGCSLVTDAGIFALCDLCPNLTPTIDISGTQVTTLPKRWASADGMRTTCTPLLYPKARADIPTTQKGKQPPLKPEEKDLLGVCIAHHGPVHVDLLSAIQGKKQPEAGKLSNVQYQGNVALTPDITAFIVETQQSLAPMFISGRSVVVIPSTLTDKNKITEEATSIASLIIQIRTKHENVPIILVGCSTSEQGIIPTAVVAEQVHSIMKKLGSVLREKYPVLSTQKKEGVVENVNVTKQLEISRAICLMERVEAIMLLDLEINLDKNEDLKPLLTLIANAAKVTPSLKDVSYDKEIYDWALSFPSKCPSTLKSSVATLDDAAQTISSNSTFKERLRPFGAIFFLRNIGQFCCWDSHEKGTLVASNEWMCGVLNTLMDVTRSGQKNDGQNHVIDDATSVWLMDNLKKEMDRVKTGWDQVEELIQSNPGVFYSNGRVVVPWTSLSLDSTMTQDIFTNFDKDAKDNTNLHLMMSFALDVNITPAILHSILAHAIKLQAPVHAWQTGVIMNDSVVAIMIAATGYSKLLNLCAYMPYFKNASSSQPELMWSTLNRYKMIIEYFLATSGLQAETILRASQPLLPAPAKVGAVVNGHRVEDDVDGMCFNCGVSISEAAMLSAYSQVLEPSFCNDESVKVTNGSVEGSVIKFTGKGAATVKSTILSPAGNSECTFTLIQGVVRNLKFIFSSRKPLYPVVVSLKDKKVIFADKTQNVSDKIGEGTLQGSILTAKLRGAGPIYMDFYLGPKLLASSEVPNSRYTVHVDASDLNDGEGVVASVSVSGMRFSSSGAELKVGMKLEALDRKTPTLICVATIEEMRDDQIKIHFDGWTDRYDFWTVWETDDLHPLGYMEHMKQTNGHKRRVNKALQEPNGYRKSFHWPTYLEEENAEPVPYELFSESQIQGTPPTATEEAQEHLGISYSMGNTDSPNCNKKLIRTSRYKALSKTVIKGVSESNPKDWEMNRYVFLPNFLSVDTLRFHEWLYRKPIRIKKLYPVLKDVFDIKKMNLHFLCDWQGVDFHLTDHPGLPVTKTPFESSDKWPLVQADACMMLLIQKQNLPVDPSSLIAGVDKLQSEKIPQLELGLARLFMMYCTFGLVLEEARSKAEGAKDNNTLEKSIPDFFSAVQEIMKSAMENDKKFSQNFHYKTGSEGIICHAHKLADSPQSQIQEIKIEHFKGLTPRIYYLNMSDNPLSQVPEDTFKQFNNLTRLHLNSCNITELPTFSQNVSLEEIDVRGNKLTSLPEDIAQLRGLKILQISGNPMGNVPSKISSLTSLVHLAADNIGHFDMKIVCKLDKLEFLSVSHNLITELPEKLDNPLLHTLYMAGLPHFPPTSSFAASSINTFLDNTIAYREISAKDRQEMIEKADSNGDSNTKKINEFNKLLRARFAPFTKTKGFEDGDFPSAVLMLEKLSKLHLSNHTFVSVPDTIKQLSNLTSLNLESNPRLESVSPEIANLEMKELHLRDCPLLKTPPKEVVRRGFAAVFGFLKRLLQGSVLCKRTKLMMVGLGGAGKTSLVRALTNKAFKYNQNVAENITDGIDITEWSVQTSKYPEVNDESSDSPLRFSVWDFAGQTVYYNTHQFFLSNRAVYLLLWNIRLGFEHAGLDFWLSSVTCHAPKAPIVIVGTHCDKVERGKLPIEELKRKFPKIVGFHFVSSYTGEGVDHLRLEVIKSALKQNYMGEKIPEAWLSLEVGLDRVRGKKSLVTWEEIEEVANTSGIFDKVELTQSVQFLHDLGSVQFFNTPFLKSHVVIVPQWIVDVMACIVTVHDGPTKDGKLNHKDMALVWADYPKDLHPWLLRLTEEFDLTFPIAKQEANVVPCLLPTSEPKYEFLPINKDKHERESQMIYRFEYLPAGLFNRVQVRLHQFSDTSLMWKKGFMLKKNGHRALLIQTSNTEVDVIARGFKPENTIFLIHEVIECLVADSYAGVSYDFSLPCLDCASNYTLEPSMFHASKVKRAVEMKAPFLQCDKHFHVISIPEIRAAMPPDRQSDFDEHLGRSVRELQELEEGVAIKCLFIYSKKNVPDLAQEGKAVNPVEILTDLRKNGYTVSYCDDPETANMESMTLAIKTAQVVIICISDDFVKSEQCRDLIIYIKQTLNKIIALVVLGKTTDWQKTDINLVLADELFVRMSDMKQYPIKLKELKEIIKTKVLKKKVTYPECFISYCWANSKSAVELGTPEKDGALGWADPRKIKDFLQEKGVNCWLDVNQMGQEGFFEDIAEGLRKAKVMVACVSDEYAISKNCKMEFRFALSTLRIPTVLAVVGTGYLWERSEIGLLTVGHGNSCPKINLQYPNEGGMLDLLKAVQALIPSNDKDKSSEVDLKSQQDVAFQEVLELAQRKLLRQIMMYESLLDFEDYPRLIMVDLKSSETKRPKSSRTPRNKEKTLGENEEQSDAVGAEPPDDDSEKSDTYCYRLFCEHELGWHESPETLPFPSMENAAMSDFLKSVSAYTVRLMAILKHTKSQLHILNTPAGEQLQRKMEEWCNRSNSDFKDEYQIILNSVIGEDKNQTFGGLKRCNMPNKKTLWLCPVHEAYSLKQTEDKFKDKIGTNVKEVPEATTGDGEDATDFETDSFVDSASEMSYPDTPAEEIPAADLQKRVRSITLAQPARGPALPPSRPKVNRRTSGKKTGSQACRLM